MNRTFAKIVGFTVARALALGANTGTAGAAEDAPSVSSIDPSVTATQASHSNVVVKAQGVYVNNVFYTQQAFRAALEQAVTLVTPQMSGTATRAAAITALPGLYFIPAIGEIVITAAGIIIIGGAAIAAGIWLWNTI